MKTLNDGSLYNYNGIALTVLKREGPFVLAGNADYGFEVFKVRTRRAQRMPDGTLIEAGEYPPKTSEFGSYASHFPPNKKHLAEKIFEDWVNGKLNAVGVPQKAKKGHFQRSGVGQNEKVDRYLTAVVKKYWYPENAKKRSKKHVGHD